jgi:hypothetical protein
MVQSAQKVGDKGREVQIWGRTSGGRPRGKVKLSGGSETAQIDVRTSDVDGEGDTAVSTSSSKFDPVEDMVVIPIPPPVIHTLIPVEVPEAFVPRHFGRLLLLPMSHHVRRIQYMMGFQSIGWTQGLVCRRSTLLR